MSTLLAIDPGSSQSAWVLLDGDTILDHDKEPNEALLDRLREGTGFSDDEDPDLYVIEDLEPRQQPLGREVADTLRWIGRFMEAASPLPVHLVTRRAVTAHHIDGGTKGADSRIRGALIDRYGGTGGKAVAIGTKAAPGPLYGVSKDVWQALAVACAWADTHEEETHE